jgi:hypothetical protein
MGQGFVYQEIGLNGMDSVGQRDLELISLLCQMPLREGEP